MGSLGSEVAPTEETDILANVSVIIQVTTNKKTMKNFFISLG